MKGRDKSMGSIIIENGKEIDGIIRSVKLFPGFKSLKKNPLKNRLLFKFEKGYTLIIEYAGANEFLVYVTTKNGDAIYPRVSFDRKDMFSLDELSLSYMPANTIITLSEKIVIYMNNNN